MAKIDLDAVKRTHDLQSVVVSITGQEPVKHKIACPFHGSDSTPSLHVYDNGRWHCYGCGAGGDVLDFVGLFLFGNGYDPAQHLLKVVDHLGGLNIAQLSPPARPATQQKPARQPVAIPVSNVTAWNRTMPVARRKYWHTRGLVDETIDGFALGWDGKRYTIPAIYRGICYGVKRRQSEINDGITTKYVMTKGSRVGLFNADVLTMLHGGELPLFIVEGEIEAMLIDQLGFAAISSTGGAGTWKGSWSRFLAHIRNIIVIYDNDDPGQAGALKVRQSLHRAKIMRWPELYHDGGDFLPTPDAWAWLNELVA